MFSGIIEEIGKIRDIKRGVKANNISVSAKKIFTDLKDGDSISIDGACMTVSMLKENEFSVDASFETLNITTLADLKKDLIKKVFNKIKRGFLYWTIQITLPIVSFFLSEQILPKQFYNFKPLIIAVAFLLPLFILLINIIFFLKMYRSETM